MSSSSDVMMASNESEYNISDATASQYWRELRTGLSSYTQFTGVSRSIGILTKIIDLIGEVENLKKKETLYAKLMEEKDNKISKLQKRNESLTDILADELNQKKTAKTYEQSVENGETPSDSESVSSQKEDNGLRNYHLVVDEKNALYAHWKTVSDDRDLYKNKYGDVQAMCDELKQKLAMLKGGQPNNMTTTGAKGDKDVILKRDKNGKCGLKFGSIKKVPLLAESNTVITNVKPGIPNYSEIGIGDFVIEVNGCNVQHFGLGGVLDLVDTDGDLILKLRPSKRNLQYTSKTVGENKSFDEWGLTFGVYAKEVKKGKIASTKGINEMDELIKVNSKNVQDLSLQKIHNSLNKDVKFVINHQQSPYDLNETDSYQSSAVSSISGRSGRSTPLPLPPRPSSVHDSVNDTPSLPSSGIRRPPALYPDDASASSGSSKQDSLCDAPTLRRNIGLTDSQLLINNPNLTDLTGQFSGGSDPFSSGNDLPSSGGPSGDDTEFGRISTDSEIVLCTVKKYDYEAFGWTFIGGNKVGIYIKSIDNWSPIEKAGIGVGWKILDIDGTKLVNIPFSFAMDFMSSLRLKTSIIVKLEKNSRDIYSSEISRRPYDNFHIRALTDYRRKTADESSFKMDDTFCVTDSYYFDASNTLKWVAKNTNTGQSVIIPCQKAKFILDEDGTSNRRSRNVPVRYYDILDEVDVKTTIEEEVEGAF